MRTELESLTAIYIYIDNLKKQKIYLRNTKI